MNRRHVRFPIIVRAVGPVGIVGTALLGLSLPAMATGLLDAPPATAPPGITRTMTQDVAPIAPIGADRAIAAAAAEVPGSATETRLLYGVTIGSQIVLVDAFTGAVVAAPALDDTAAAPDAAQTAETVGATSVAAPVALTEGQNLLPQATLTVEEAALVAQAAVPGTIRNVELLREQGLLLFEVTIGNQEVYIDATTGAVFDIEPAGGGD